MTTAAVLAAIQVKSSAAQSGIVAPTYPPESANEFPASIVYPSVIGARAEDSSYTHLFEEYVLQVHFARANTDLATVVAAVAPFAETFITGCRNDPQLGSTVDTCFREDMRAVFGEMDYGSIKTIGWTFTIYVKRRV